MNGTVDTIDLFAGPGGWEQGMAAHLGHTSVLGIEWDAAACATAEAAGHRRLQADIALLDPRAVARAYGLTSGDLCGLIGSPPCQGFSPAGKGLGRGDTPRILDALDLIAAGFNPDAAIGATRGYCADERSALVLEPLRWALDLNPEWICWEQVPAVLPLWERCAEILQASGYHVWTGAIQAERYGVPQTRKRAVLIASRIRVVGEPVPTHSRYHPAAPERLDPGTPRWVSMAEALGWHNGDIEFAGAGATSQFTAGQIPRPMSLPAHTVTGKGTAAWILRSNYGTGGDPADRSERAIDRPAPTVTSKIGRNKWVLRGSNQAHAAKRPLDTPSPTLLFAERCNKVEWIDAALASDPQASGRRITVEEAGVLQSFPADYPWRGNSGERYRQVGDAVPPLLAAHVVAEATD